MCTSESHQGGRDGQQGDAGGRGASAGGVLVGPVLVHVGLGTHWRLHQPEVGLVQVQFALQKRLQPAGRQPQIFGRVEGEGVRPLDRFLVLDRFRKMPLNLWSIPFNKDFKKWCHNDFDFSLNKYERVC